MKFRKSTVVGMPRSEVAALEGDQGRLDRLPGRGPTVNNNDNNDNT